MLFGGDCSPRPVTFSLHFPSFNNNINFFFPSTETCPFDMRLFLVVLCLLVALNKGAFEGAETRKLT